MAQYDGLSRPTSTVEKDKFVTNSWLKYFYYNDFSSTMHFIHHLMNTESYVTEVT